MAILLPAEASKWIPDRPFLIGLEGPIRNVSVMRPCWQQTDQTTCNLLFGSVQHLSLGTSSWISLGTD